MCADDLTAGPRPVVQVGATAGVVIIGQAPGRRVHESGVPWDDPSGERLRSWLGVDSEAFYDPARVALIPMGFCYPGTGPSGDLPPRPECAPLWHEPLLGHLGDGVVKVIIGAYAQKRYVPDRKKSLTETVRAWQDYAPDTFVLPHPSPRNQRWFKQNPWFDTEVIPALRSRINSMLGN